MTSKPVNISTVFCLYTAFFVFWIASSLLISYCSCSFSLYASSFVFSCELAAVSCRNLDYWLLHVAQIVIHKNTPGIMNSIVIRYIVSYRCNTIIACKCIASNTSQSTARHAVEISCMHSGTWSCQLQAALVTKNTCSGCHLESIHKNTQQKAVLTCLSTLKVSKLSWYWTGQNIIKYNDT